MNAPWQTVVLLHGFGGAAESWRRVRAALPGPTLAIDLPGHAGRPMVPSFGAAIEALAAEIPEGAWLVGYSLGGRLALGLAAADPDRYAGLILIGAHPGLDDPGERAARCSSDDAWADRLDREGPDRFFEAWDAQPIFGGRQLAPDILADERAWRAKHVPAELAQAMRVFSLGRMPSQWPVLERWKRPLIAVAGEHDPKFIEVGRRVTAIAGALEIIAGTHHVVPLEAPSAVAAIVAPAVRGSAK